MTLIIISGTSQQSDPDAHGNTGTERDRNGNQTCFHGTDDAGQQIPADRITDGIGNGQPGHQQHQRTDDGAVNVVDKLELFQYECRQRQQHAGTGNLNDKIDLPAFEFLYAVLCQAADEKSEKVAFSSEFCYNNVIFSFAVCVIKFI